VTALLHEDFADFCDATGLRKFCPGLCVSGGLDVDGQVVPIEDSEESEVDDLDDRWIGRGGVRPSSMSIAMGPPRIAH